MKMGKIVNNILQKIHFLDKDEESIPAIAGGHICSFETDVIFESNTHDIFVYLVLRGSLNISSDEGQQIIYPGEYYLSSSTKKVASRIVAVTDEMRHLALQFYFQPDEVVDVLLDMEVNFTAAALKKSSGTPIESSSQNEILNLVDRIMSLPSGAKNAFLEKHFKRELIYHLIVGKDGASLVEEILKKQGPKIIYNINDWIKKNFKSVFDINDLTKRANMSASNLHRKFKETIGMSPIKCQKQLRLIEARRLMLNSNVGVTIAALEVGYESISQFSRDYKKMFGLSPQKDIKYLQTNEI